MISDQALIDNINPFVVRPHMSLPGTWSDPYNFDKYDIKETISNNTLDKEYVSPICSYGITAGDRTIDFCTDLEPNCPMSRMLEPKRNIDYGFTIHRNSENFQMFKKKSKNNFIPFVFLLIGVSLLLLLSYRM